MSLYLGNQLISGANTPIQGRVLGQIIQSTIPLSDAGLHLLDGSLIQGTGAYSAFYNHMSNGYSSNSIGMKGNVSNNNGVFSNFNSNNYLFIPNAKTVDNSEYVFKFTTGSDVTTLQAIAHTENFFSIEINEGRLFTYIGGNVILISSIQTNTTYWIKSNFSMQDPDIFVRAFYTSTDGVNYTLVYNTSSSYPTMNLNNSYQFVLGDSARSHVTPFLGSIDIKECYIKQNNTYLWNGADYTILPNYYTDSIGYQQSLESYGVCGKFVLDTVNQTIRLPKITGMIEGTINVSTLGDLIAAGLPNITGSFVSGEWTSQSYTDGAFYQSDSVGAANGSDARKILTLDASRSSSVYGNSDTVQPQTIKSYIYIVIATLTKTDIEVDIDEIATDLNGKADKDLVNVSSSDIRNALDNAGVRYVISTYNNGNSWYRIYSDGWVEQGGLYEGGNGTGYKDVNLNVAMADTNFSIIAVRNAETSTTNYNVWGQVPTTTASKTMIRVYVSNASAVVRWRVYGYKA